MKITHQKLKPRVTRMLRHFGRDRRGNVALLFGLSAMMIFSAMGAGLDLSRAYLARPKDVAGRHAGLPVCKRPIIIEPSSASYNGSNGGATYVTNVTNFIGKAWTAQNVNLTQSTGTPFTYTQGGASTVTLSSSMPTTFMSIAGFPLFQ